MSRRITVRNTLFDLSVNAITGQKTFNTTIQSDKVETPELIRLKVGISVYVDFKILNDVEANIEGKNRSQKLQKCIEKGYELLCKGAVDR